MRHRRVVALVVALAVGVGGAVAAVVLGRPSQPAATATALELSGDLAAHDPALVVGDAGQPWYVFATGEEGRDGGAPRIFSSPDGRQWTDVGAVWDAGTEPEWVRDVVPGVKNFWAPDVYEHDGTYYLYWAASTFGSNTSVIGLHTSTTLDPEDPDYGWVDRGQVLASTSEDDVNAIDPGVVVDADGTPWMAFGSFWSGIRMVEIAWPDGMPVNPSAEPLRLADRGVPPNAIEAPTIVRHDDWYFLFVSIDSCCQGLASTYRIAVGRSEDIAGPYVDHTGTPLLEGGGTILLDSDGFMVGPGGESASHGYLAFHYYDERLGGDVQLAIRELGWKDGWPVLRTG